MSALRFYLGIHQPGWLRRPELADVPVMISMNTIGGYGRIPEPRGPVKLDSGAYTRFSGGGRGWRAARPFVAAVSRVAAALGPALVAVGPQDWLCGPPMLAATGRSLRWHQLRTAANYRALRRLAPGVPWLPMLQGWSPADYLRHVEMYRAGGVDLLDGREVGVGSIAARQNTADAHAILDALSAAGITNIHAMGAHSGLRRYGALVASADSMAWSMEARTEAPLPGCTHKNCANCLRYALGWRERLLSTLGGAPAPLQLSMEDLRWAA